jgi:hypothetical protein
MASTEHLGSPCNIAKEEKKLLENALQKSTRGVNKWTMKISSEWQGTRLTKKASDEQGNSCS